ncbi:MAG: L-histidine N(alpha)-methyltransferase [Candidatus Zixiibacteriota bacterium]
MTATYKIISESDYAETFDQKSAFALDVLVGLSEQRKRIPSKYLYDAVGSELFRRITKQPEYYVTNCEMEILENGIGSIASYVKNEPFNLVELGAGFGRKTAILIDYFLTQQLDFRYVPIDISEAAMKELSESMAERFPDVEMSGLVSDYFSGLKWLNNRYGQRNFVLFLGSSIGNFTHVQALVFLRNMWNCLSHGDYALIGFDLKKDIELLLQAYNDSQGITRAFNMNLLERINRELGGEFDFDAFRHFGTFDLFSGGMESYLVSLKRQSVYIDMIGRSFELEPWEPIHTEYSYKYLISDIEKLASESGFVIDQHILDSRQYFADSILRVSKPEYEQEHKS